MNPEIHLIKSILLNDFPSGSSINFNNDKLYLIGDDATQILILDSEYNKIDAIQLFDHTELRIPKDEKMDLEGSTIVEMNGETNLFILGSASRKQRKTVILIPLSKLKSDFKFSDHFIIQTREFIKRLKSHGLAEINLEGSCLFHRDMLLGNRGNLSSQNNHLIITDQAFFERQNKAKLIIIKLLLPDDQNFLGVSELCYVPVSDILFITLTNEATNNSYDDGVVGNSYLGWITDANNKLRQTEVLLTGMINLETVDEVLKNQKVEGICVESVKGNEFLLHMVSDNDVGESRLFKIIMTLNEFSMART